MFVRASTLVLSLASATASVISVSIPSNSQNPLCRPSYDNVWNVTAPPFPIGAFPGIGIIINPTWTSRDDNQDFALHQNDDIQPSPLYMAPNVPDPRTATVTYTFDHAEVITGVEIVQHENGITQVEGFLGNSTNTLVSLGAVFGPSGDIVDGTWVVPSDGMPQVFHFDNACASGTVLQITIRKTSHPTAFATHRIFPLDARGAPIPFTTNKSPVPGTEELELETSLPEATAITAAPNLGPRLVPPASAGNGNFQFSVVGVAGSQCKIQTSTNLQHWITLLTNTVPFTFTTNKSTGDKQRFFRAVSLP
jgi:hypothetical protein